MGAESPCAPCPAGSTSVAGATACSSCADGHHTTEEGTSRCLPCPAGNDLSHHFSLRPVHSWVLWGDRGCNGLHAVSAGFHYSLRRPVCMFVVPSWQVWSGGWLRVLSYWPLHRRRGRDCLCVVPLRIHRPVRASVFLYALCVWLVWHCVRLRGVPTCTQKFLANHAACAALPAPSLCSHAVQPAMPALQDSPGSNASDTACETCNVGTFTDSADASGVYQMRRPR